MGRDLKPNHVDRQAGRWNRRQVELSNRCGTARLLALSFALSAVGCAEPFTVERHSLGPPRLAAMGVWSGQARAAVWSGRGAWHESSPALSWRLDGDWIGDGFEVTVDNPGVLEVEVVLEDGTELSGAVTAGAEVSVEVVRQAVARPGDLSRTARLQVVDPEPRAGAAAMREMVRLTAQRDDGASGTMRWMLGASDWSVLELHANAADVVPAEVNFEDGLIADVVDGAAGIGAVLALSVDGGGHNGWTWLDVAFDVNDALLPVQGHLFPISPETATDAVLQGQGRPLSHVVATLRADPSGPATVGIRLEDVEAGGDLQRELVDHPTPDCAPGDGGFVLWAVAEGRCSVPSIDGARVVLEL